MPPQSLELGSAQPSFFDERATATGSTEAVYSTLYAAAGRAPDVSLPSATGCLVRAVLLCTAVHGATTADSAVPLLGGLLPY